MADLCTPILVANEAAVSWWFFLTSSILDTIAVLFNIVNNLTIELGKLGVEIDDPALGIVNFPSLRGIETVFLSYRLGEKSVRHWHEYDENYESRRALEQELDIIKQ